MFLKKQENSWLNLCLVSSKKPLPEATEEEVKEMDAWVKDLNTSKSDYMWNAKSAWTKEYAEYRDIALMSSFVNVYP